MSEADPITCIRKSVQKVTLENKGMIDANRIATSIHAAYPSYDIARLTDMVVDEVIRAGGT